LVGYDIGDLPDEDKARINPFDWTSKTEGFGGIMAAGGFDAVIGNPPFLSSDNINKQNKLYFETAFPEVAQHRYDLACIFMERGLGLLRRGAILGLLQPSHILTGEYLTPVRKFLLSQSQLQCVIDFKETAFEEVSNPICAIVVSKGSNGQDYSFEAGEVASSGSISSLRIWKKSIASVSADRLVNAAGQSVESSRIILSKTYEVLERRTRHNTQSLSDVAIVTDGIQTADLLKVIFTQSPNKPSDYVRALRSGKDIPGRYGYVQWGGWYVLKPDLAKKYSIRFGVAYRNLE
jgi:hypothetical protein